MTNMKTKRDPSKMSVLDYINMSVQLEKEGSFITKEEFTRIRNHGTEEELIEALEIMEKMGGYENLV